MKAFSHANARDLRKLLKELIGNGVARYRNAAMHPVRSSTSNGVHRDAGRLIDDDDIAIGVDDLQMTAVIPAKAGIQID